METQRYWLSPGPCRDPQSARTIFCYLDALLPTTACAVVVALFRWVTSEPLPSPRITSALLSVSHDCYTLDIVPAQGPCKSCHLLCQRGFFCFLTPIPFFLFIRLSAYFLVPTTTHTHTHSHTHLHFPHPVLIFLSLDIQHRKPAQIEWSPPSPPLGLVVSYIIRISYCPPFPIPCDLYRFQLQFFGPLNPLPLFNV